MAASKIRWFLLSSASALKVQVQHGSQHELFLRPDISQTKLQQ